MVKPSSKVVLLNAMLLNTTCLLATPWLPSNMVWLLVCISGNALSLSVVSVPAKPPYILTPSFMVNQLVASNPGL
ncbi:hypothetical protein D3C86_785520 [compost metagenome]